MRRKFRVLFTALASLGSLLVATPTLADDVSGTRSTELVEVDHTIELKMDHGHATLVVRRTFKNGGKKHDQAMVHIDSFPAGAVATGLRTMAMKDGNPIWYSGELLEAELAAKRYKELTGIGGYYPKDPALLSWRHQGLLYLQVFPVDPGGKKTVEYTFEVPTLYENGRDVLRLPEMGTTALPARVTVLPVHTGDSLFLGASPVVSGAKLNANLSVDLGLARDPATQPKLSGTAASVWFEKGRTLFHSSVEVAPKLSTVPKDASVIVILDASRSLTNAQRSAELAAARAYLGHFVGADANVEVLTFARKVSARHEGFIPAKDAIADLAKLTLKTGNGSAIDEAFAEAKRRLSARPANSPKRVIAITDLRTRAAITPETVASLSSAIGGVVHLATIEEGTPFVDRDDDTPWAKVARPTGGVFWRARASASAKDAASMTKVYEEWARPVRIDRIALTAVGVTAGGLGLPSTMHEGDGFEDLRITGFAPPALAIAGELWSTPIKTKVEPTEEQNRLWSALVFGSPLMHDLKEPEMMTLAMKGHAVSPVTSYLAIEPGVRPSTEGLEESESFGFGGLGLSGIGHGGGGGMKIGVLDLFDRRAFLRGELAKALKTCGAGTRTITVRFETTLQEIVSAKTTALSGTKDDVLKTCMEEAAWAIELPAGFREEWAAWDVTLGGDAK